MSLRTPYERPSAPAEVLLALFPGLWKNTFWRRAFTVRTGWPQKCGPKAMRPYREAVAVSNQNDDPAIAGRGSCRSRPEGLGPERSGPGADLLFHQLFSDLLQHFRAACAGDMRRDCGIAQKGRVRSSTRRGLFASGVDPYGLLEFCRPYLPRAHSALLRSWTLVEKRATAADSGVRLKSKG